MFHLREQSVVEQILSLRMQRRVDRYHVADLNHVLDRRMENHVEFFLDRFWQALPIEIMQMHVKRLQPPQDSSANSSGSHRSDVHTFDVVRTLYAIGDIPSALYYPPIRGQVVAYEREDHHHRMFGDADRIGIGYFGHGDATVDRSLEIDMVGA